MGRCPVAVQGPGRREWERARLGGTRSRSMTKEARKLILAIAALIVVFAVAIAVVLAQPWASNTQSPNTIGLSIGQLAPDFTIEDVNGTKWNLSGHRGQVVLIDFMGSNCATCIREMKEGVLQAVHDAYASHGFAMISIDVGGSLGTESPAEAWRFLRGLSRYGTWEPGTWPIALDDQGLAGTYLVSGLPLKYLIDKDGRIAWKWWTVRLEDLDARIRAALG